MSSHLHEFGPYRLDEREGVLTRDGTPLMLTPKALQTLIVLVQRCGHIVEKEELMTAVWPDTAVEDSNLTFHISVLRKALGGDQKYIETVPRRGYRFVAPVRHPDEQIAAGMIQERRIVSRLVIRQDESLIESDAPIEEVRAQHRTRAIALPPAQVSSRWWLRPRVLLPLLASLLVIGGISANLWFGRSPTRRAATLEVHSVAVLPFKNITPAVTQAADDEYLRVGIADALITKLANVKQLKVLPTSAVLRPGVAETEALDAGRALGVDAVMEGSIQRAGDTIRITTQLVSGKDGSTLWAGTFDDKENGIFHIQDAISNQIAYALALQLTGEERERLARNYTENTEAYHAYLKGRYYWNKRTPDGLKRAIDEFHSAIEQDPLDALAYAGLADAYLLFGEYNVEPPRESFAKGKAAAQRALELDDNLGQAHASLAYVYANYDWNFPGAEKEYRKAIELNPNYSTAHQWYAEFLTLMKRYDEAEAEISLAAELDPLSPIVSSVHGLLLYHARRYDAAVKQLQKAVELDSGFVETHAYLALVYEQQRQDDAFLSENLTVLTLSGVPKEAIDTMRRSYETGGRTGYLRMQLAGVEAMSKTRYTSAFDRAFIQAQLGDPDRTMEWLEKSFEERHRYTLYANVDPNFDFMRSDPRFLQLLDRLNLAR